MTDVVPSGIGLVEQAFLRTIRRRLARQALIKDDKAYAALYGQLQTAMTNAWSDAMREGIAAALDRLRDLGPGRFTAEDGATILRVLEGSVGPEAIRAAMREPVVNLTDALWRTGAQEVGASTGVSIAFQRPDLDALDALKRANLHSVGGSWNAHTTGKLRAILDEYFTEGMTREGLARRMAEDFATLTSRSNIYWEIVADHIATKTREIGRVTGYERAGIARVQVRARIDGKTSAPCRAMHGRVIEVTTLRAQADAYVEAANRGDEATIREVWTMHGEKSDLSEVATKDLKGTASPPYHFRCRTITVAYFGAGGSDVAAWAETVQNRGKLSAKETGAVIDRAKSAAWPHTKVVRGHFRKHQGKLGIDSQAAFSQSAVDLIRRADRDVYLSVRKGVLNATFVRPAKNRETGEDGIAVTAVDLVENKITTHHWRGKMGTQKDEVPATKQPGRGIAKWLFG